MPQDKNRPMQTHVSTAMHALGQYRQWRQHSPAPMAAERLCVLLRGANERDWLDVVRGLAMEPDPFVLQTVLSTAITEHPHSFDLRRALGGVYRRIGRGDEAERVLRQVLDEKPDDISAALTLADMLKDVGRVRAAAECLRACAKHHLEDAELMIRTIEFLDACDRKADAAEIAEAAIAVHPADVRLHAYAGMLEIQLGEFEKARAHYLYVLERDERAYDWNIPLGLAQIHKYQSADHPDFALLARGLQHRGLSAAARSSLLFAIGKASDDVRDFEAAARYFREANELARRLTKWTPAWWTNLVESRLSAAPIPATHTQTGERAPIFIVGLPRSGTTLVAELLARLPEVCNRGELPWIPWLFDSAQKEPRDLDHIAADYMMRLHRDDFEAQWFIDKQPLNLRYVDFILALWPEAKIVHCTRDPRDNAMSLWMQSFHEDLLGFAYDFDHIAQVMRDCDRLMDRWRREFPSSIREVRYEDLVRNPQVVIGELASWIGIDGAVDVAQPRTSSPAIGTASLWQVRQPVYASSVGRWRNYLPFVPELVGFAES
jgi:tetratricopeptide (TPR) repeat protein